jgi:hypothetical protein
VRLDTAWDGMVYLEIIMGIGGRGYWEHFVGMRALLWTKAAVCYASLRMTDF